MHWDQLPGTFFGPPTLVDLLRHRAARQPNDIAFTFLTDGEDEQVHITNLELDQKARAIGAWLESLGLTGNRALLLYPAGLDFIAAFFGCLYAGVVAVPVYPPRRNRSLARIQAIANDARAKVALTTEAVLQRVDPLIGDTPDLKRLTWLATCHVPEGMENRWQTPDIDAHTLAFLQYTSGSTGHPKGVMLDHANLLHNSALIAHAFEHTRSGLGVFWLPSYHDMGLIGGILQPLYIGRPNVLMSPMSFLTRPLRWLTAISRFGATTSGGPNFAYDLCVRKITPEERDTLDLSSWEVAFNGAEPVRAETLDRFAEYFAPCGFRREAFYPCFGLAEATLIVSGGYVKKAPVIRSFDAAALSAGQVVADVEPDADGVRMLVGCGQTLSDQEIVIADPQSFTRCPQGKVGEIWLRGPSVALGYWDKPDATESTFRAQLKDTGEGPFLRTGDLGFIEEGELFVTGRIKDMIILHGVNLYPQDIEYTVQQCHPRLRPDSGAVFSVERDGREQLIVVSEVDRRKLGDLQEVFDAVRRAVSAEHEVGVDAIVLIKVGSIPKTSSGKIQRHACRNGYLAGSLEVVGQWSATDSQPARLATAYRVDEALEAPVQDEEVVETRLQRGRPVVLSKNGKGSSNGSNGKVGTNGRHHKNSDSPVPATTLSAGGVAEAVLEQVRQVAKERADGLTLDSPITEIGLDSLERMEILASLEKRFGGRFPEEVLPELETCREVVDAVQKHLGARPDQRPLRPANAEISPECYEFSQFPEYRRLKQNLEILTSTGIGNPYFTVHEGVTNDRTVIGGRELINFSSYNYVGMSGDPVVTKAVQAAVQRYGTSVSASRLVSGQKPVHRDLESAIAQFVGTEDAVVFVGGHSTNETVIGHLLGANDLVLHDALSHNSIVQGCILSGAHRRPFPHNDWQAVDHLLQQYRHEYRRVLIVIEGVYSMDGDIPMLPEFIEVKRRHKALLMIDEAHSMGTLGAHGRGIGEHFSVDRADVDLWMGTLSKSFGSCGGYIAGCQALVEYLRYTAPGFVYSVGLSPPNAAAALASLELLKKEPQRVRRLQQQAKLFLELAKRHGLNTGRSSDSPVVPVILGNSIHCLQLSRALFARGINVQPILYPAVEESAARLRFFLTSLHTEKQVRYTIRCLVEELEKIDAGHLTRPDMAPVATAESVA